MRKFAFGFVASLGLVGFVMADTYNANLTKQESGKVTVTKAGGFGGGAGGKKAGGKKAGGDPPMPAVLDLAADCVIGKGKQEEGKFGPAAWSLDTKFSDGLKNDAFKDASDTAPVLVKITTADEDKGAVKKGQVTEIITIVAGAGAGGKKAGGKKAGAKKG